ncbi:MAG TPA: sugar transferase [Solirubrobacteraceae bacterium]|nr:sugar transferase [Solirubrobacteraceae bacterium]
MTAPTRLDEPLSVRYAAMAREMAEPRASDTVLRALDVAVAGVGLAAMALPMAAIALAIRLTSGPPVLYRGLRVGRGGELFTMYKFRTLTPDAETRLGPYLGPELTTLTEMESTRLGRLLRAAHLDELPQLWNVLTGTMSVVGPRPIRPTFFEELCRDVPQYWQRLVVRPGITGLAQLRMTREMTWSEKLAHDLEYIADRSPGLYLSIATATLAQGLGSTPRRGH